MNKIPNSKVMCDVLIETGKKDRNILVLTSDSRGSGKLVDFAEALPEQIIEVGIAEQNIVSVAAGLSHSGKRSFVASPAAFLSMRSIEQIKVDVAYSGTNVKLVGISGGVSYGALGMSHHSLQDFAVTRAIPGIQVLCPADRFETELMFKALTKTSEPAYIRIGRHAVEDCYESTDYGFELGKASIIRRGNDVTLIGIGETVYHTIQAAKFLEAKGIEATVISVHALKPFDSNTIADIVKKSGHVITVEEHSLYGGLGSAVAETLSEETGIKHRIIAFPDEELITGESKELFEYYGLTGDKIADQAVDLLGR